MIQVVWDAELQADYLDLFNHCAVHPNSVLGTDDIVAQIAANRGRYEAVAQVIGMPWFVVGIIHDMECSFSFLKHLANGDDLGAPTIHVPRNRPRTERPWNWTWEESAIDVLKLLHFDTWKDYSIQGILYMLESWSGMGYRMYHPQCKSPYLWSATNQYIKGKYTSDGNFNKNVVSQQIGAAAIIKRGIVLKVWEVE